MWDSNRIRVVILFGGADGVGRALIGVRFNDPFVSGLSWWEFGST